MSTVAEIVASPTGTTPTPSVSLRPQRAIATARFTTPQEVASLVTMLAPHRTGNVTRVKLCDRPWSDEDDPSKAAPDRRKHLA